MIMQNKRIKNIISILLIAIATMIVLITTYSYGHRTITTTLHLVNASGSSLSNCYVGQSHSLDHSGEHIVDGNLKTLYHGEELSSTVKTGLSDHEVGVGFPKESYYNQGVLSNETPVAPNYSNDSNKDDNKKEVKIETTFYHSDDNGDINLTVNSTTIKHLRNYDLNIRVQCGDGVSEGRVRLGIPVIGIVNRSSSHIVHMKSTSSNSEPQKDTNWILSKVGRGSIPYHDKTVSLNELGVTSYKDLYSSTIQ